MKTTTEKSTLKLVYVLTRKGLGGAFVRPDGSDGESARHDLDHAQYFATFAQAARQAEAIEGQRWRDSLSIEEVALYNGNLVHLCDDEYLSDLAAQ